MVLWFPMFCWCRFLFFFVLLLGVYLQLVRFQQPLANVHDQLRVLLCPEVEVDGVNPVFRRPRVSRI
jgi:hypothetical protein